MSPPLDAKAALRAEARRFREAIDPTARLRAADRVAERVQAVLADIPPGIVAGYAAIGSELDPEPAMVRLATGGWRLALPVMAGRSEPLVFRAWTIGAPLQVRQWGIREPGIEAEVVVPDVLLVPLLAFDRAGHRLGYGGGYYDRTLAALAPAVRTIGLAFREQCIDAVPALAYDQALSCIVTPDGVITPSSPA
jgi:5-formyltetrahydrofolate cyclo-ligase